MKLFFLIFSLFYHLSFAQEVVKIKETNLDVAIGIDEIVKFDYKFSTKVKMPREDVLKLSINPSAQTVTVIGVKAGRVSVTVFDDVGNPRDKFIVNVTSDGNSNIVRELRELIGDIEGIKIGIKGGKVVVEGELVVPTHIGRINTVMSKYSDVLVLIEYSTQTQIIVAQKMQEAINRNNMKDVTVRVVNGDYWLEGVVNSDGKKTLAQNIATSYLPDTLASLSASVGGDRYQKRKRGGISNFISVNQKKDPEPPPKLIKVSSQFVELSKDYLKVFAFKWAPFMSNESSISFGQAEDGTVSTSNDGTLSGTISRLFPKLTSAKQAGYARVIQSGMAVTNNNKPISIKKDSVVNFAVGDGDGQTSQSISITFSMNATPVIQNEENVLLDSLVVSVSLPNGTGSDGTPQATTNEVKTNITVKSKESAVIGGIVQSNSATAYDKNDPDNVEATSDEDTTQVSELFSLLRSKSYTNEKSQFVVFVTPEILESASKGTEEIRRKFRKRER